MSLQSEPVVRSECDCTGRPGRDSSFGALWYQKCPETAVSSAEHLKVDGVWPLVKRRGALLHRSSVGVAPGVIEASAEYAETRVNYLTEIVGREGLVIEASGA